jgi:hypothetical protein
MICSVNVFCYTTTCSITPMSRMTRGDAHLVIIAPSSAGGTLAHRSTIFRLRMVIPHPILLDAPPSFTSPSNTNTTRDLHNGCSR